MKPVGELYEGKPHVRFDEGRVETEYGASGIGRWEEMTIEMLRDLTHGATLLLYEAPSVWRLLRWR
jgi:hypothetical protein